MSDSKRKHKPNAVLAFLLAWAVPGAGHVYAGKPWHGLVIFVVITATFWAGMCLGGVMTVDHRSERWWFIANMMTGVHGVTSYYRREAVCEELLKNAGTSRYDEIRSDIKEDIKRASETIGELSRDRAELSRELSSTMLSSDERMGIEQELDRINQSGRQTKMEMLRLQSRLNHLKQELLDEVVIEAGMALVPPTSTVARAYAGIAGMLNMVCIFDAGLIVLMGSVQSSGNTTRRKQT